MPTDLTPDQVLSFFHYPPLWLSDKSAVNKEDHTVDFALLKAEVFRREDNLQGLKIRATRDGEFFFDFTGTGWGVIPDNLTLSNEVDKGRLASIDGLKIAAINAFLVCLYSRYRDVGGWAIRHMHVRPWQTATVASFDSTQGSCNASYGSGLKEARDPNTYRKDLAHRLDKRIADRVDTISSEVFENACDTFDLILKLPFEEGAVRVALCSAAADKLKDNEFDTSLVLSWAVVESIISQQWVASVNSGTQPQDNPKAWKMVKELADGGHISATEQADITTVREARNHWLHQFIPVDEAKAKAGLALAFALFKKFFNISLGINVSGNYRTSSHPKK